MYLPLPVLTSKVLCTPEHQESQRTREESESREGKRPDRTYIMPDGEVKVTSWETGDLVGPWWLGSNLWIISALIQQDRHISAGCHGSTPWLPLLTAHRSLWGHKIHSRPWAVLSLDANFFNPVMAVTPSFFFWIIKACSCFAFFL